MTAARYLLDTNICIYIHRQRPTKVMQRFQKLRPGEAVISVVTWGELLYGAEKSREQNIALERLQEFTTLIPVLPLPTAAGHAYGPIRAALETRGTPIGNNDLWIAAPAKSENLTLVTNNEREFRRVAGLRIQNWAS